MPKKTTTSESEAACLCRRKLRIAPTCSHVLSSSAGDDGPRNELLYDEGLKSADGSPAYTILHDSMVPLAWKTDFSHEREIGGHCA
jgi:hypothetical protein